MGKIKIRPIICLGLFLALLSTLLPGSVPASADEATVVISISPSHSRVGIDEEFWVSVDINDVSQLNSYQFDITYDPTVIRIEGNEGGNAITGGRLTDTSTNPEDITDYPIEWWYTTAGTQGRATISGSLARYLGGSGSGYLANIHFKAVGTYNDTCSITPVKASLKNRLNVDIPVNYTLRGNVEIPYPPITVSIDSPANLQAGGEFAARIIISQVVNLQAFQFEVSYDPDVINIIGEEGGAEGVTPGQIDVSIIDPEMWVYYPIGSPGTVRIISNLPEKSGVSGEGHLVDLHFHVSGSQGQSTPLSLSNISEFKNKLFDPDGNEFSDVTWIDTECQINSLCSIISTSPLPKAEVGLFYQTELEAWGGVLPYQWSIIDGLLPNGLSLDASTGIISGTPTSSDDSCHIIVQVIDNDGNISTKNMEITALAAVEIINAALPDGELGTPYTQRLIANGGLPPYTWEIISGTLPSGLFLNASTGTISGIPTVNASSQEVTFMVTDSKGAFNTKELALNIPDDLVITTNSPLPTGEVGMRYNYQMTSAGGEQPARWSIVTGSLPSGLYLNAATGVISGTPTTAKTSTFICFQATDTAGTSVTKTITLTIMAGPRITTTILPVKEVGAPYMAILGVSGGVAPFIWSIESGTLPEGLTFNSQNGFISGTPTEVTPATAITFGLLDSLGGQATKRLTITIQAPPTIITPSLPDGELGAEYYQVLTARGGVGPYTWTIESGSLPPGLALNANNGVISGTITSNSTYEILLKVTDSVEGCSVRELVLTVMPGPTIITSSLAEGQISINYYQTLEASGGTTPYKWSIIAGSLPRGLVLNPSTGVISGRPVVSVNCQEITFQVTSKLGGTSSKILTITTTGKAEITTSTLSDAETGLPYLQTLTATGGKAPYTWYISPSQLPSGFTLNTSTGVISGITYIRPTRRSLYVKITDSLGGMATRNLSLTVVNGPSIKTTALADGEVGFAYNDNLEVKDGVAP
ncbi:MAG: putative Ig domain-containing protein, partial [Dehalococcoidales bacterium]|nr:putative Ig domain-containing protein [Dehalococcoidales bacterium]